MKTIHLHGSLGKKYGKVFELAVEDAVGACRLLAATIPGFKKTMRDGVYKVIRGPVKGGMRLGPEDIRMPIKNELHIFPVAQGSKNGGVGKIILGTLLIAVAIALPGSFAIFATAAGGTITGLTTAGTIAFIGAGLALGGVAMMMAPSVSSDYSDREKEDQSFLFNGVQNTTEQGGPVPLIYGRFMVGSKVISASINVEDMAISDGTSPDGTYGSASGVATADEFYTL